MTQSFDLLSLPANVFSEVSSFVGSLREFVRLDSNSLATDLVNGKLEELSLCNNDTLTDAQVLSLVKHLPSLWHLKVQRCSLLTETTLLTEYACQLLMLFVDIKHPESAEAEAILEVFSQKCTKLTYLNIDCGDKVLCHGAVTGLIVRGCPQLRELWVNKVSTIGASSRELIAQIRSNLHIDVSTLYTI